MVLVKKQCVTKQKYMSVGKGLVERRKEDDRGGRQTREGARNDSKQSVLWMCMKLSSNYQFEFFKNKNSMEISQKTEVRTTI